MIRILLFSFLIASPFMTAAATINNQITLLDGRTLGYAQYGDSSGFPIFYFHGGQESRLSSSFMDSIAQKLHIRLISPDRPGVGLSTYQPYRTFLAWANDVEELANHLAIDSFSVFGLSGGSPHVLACLVSLPHRIINSAIVSGATPYHYKGSLKGMWFPVKLIHWFASMKQDKYLQKIIKDDYESLLNKPEKRMKQFKKYLPKPDRELLKNTPDYGWGFINGSLESYNNGIEGVIQEWKMYVKPWGFEIDSIKANTDLWYGTADKMAPKSRGYYLHKQLSNSTLHLIENEGHFSLIRNHLEVILSKLLPN